MSIQKVKDFFKKYNRENDIMEFNQSSATVELAAKALDVIPAMITKTLSFKSNDGCILICTAGNTKIDNKKFKTFFGIKAKMLSAEEVETYTGHQIGGVCPFAIDNKNVKVYCDVSMQAYEKVFPACGSSNSAIGLTCDELFIFSNAAEWIDVCKIPEE